MRMLTAWAIHDLEEAVAFPATSQALAHRLGVPGLAMSRADAWASVALMGILVAAAERRGATTGGTSRLYRAVVAGLGAHVASHVAASVVARGYTAGVVTAPLVISPTVARIRGEMKDAGVPLTAADTARGVALLAPAAVVAQVGGRALVRGIRRVRRSLRDRDPGPAPRPSD